MKKLLDIENWERRDHFNFFNNFEEPFFGICVEIDCTKAYKRCKKDKISFFLYYLHNALVTANNIEEFRYRIEDNQVYIYDKINASSTIGREEGPFGFSNIEFRSDLQEFTKLANKEIERVRTTKGLGAAAAGLDVIHFTALPWLNFTSISHARSFTLQDSCPKITFGKMHEKENKSFMSLAIHAHHALVDGIHAGEFVEKFQKLMDQ